MKIFFLLLLPLAIFCNFFEERIQFAKEGDFVIYENKKNSSLLIVNQIDDKRIILEEVSFPSYLKNGIKNPKTWLDHNAPGNTSWKIYELDRASLKLKEAYSFTENSHLIFHDKDFFLSKFFSLNLTPIPDKQRRKTGPISNKTTTIRPFWNPPIIIDGKKHKEPCLAYFANWEKDGSELDGKKIELYFAPEAFFPSWIELEAARVSLPFKVTDSGNRAFIKKTPPQRRPYFTKRPYQTKDHLIAELIIPKYLQYFDLVAVDLTDPTNTPLNISYKTQTLNENTKIFIDLKTLNKNHLHRLIIMPKDSIDLSCETTFSFSDKK